LNKRVGRICTHLEFLVALKLNHTWPGSVDDASEAERSFDMLIGDAMDPRKRFINLHAKAVRNQGI